MGSNDLLMKAKVFCIGFHKTGTTTLDLALRKLGYRVTGPNHTKDPNIAEKVHELADELVQQYDAFQDNPWPILYREMDQKYPGSKFIMTIRSSDSWLSSQVRDFAYTETPMRQWIYGKGCPKGNEALYVERFERHNREVLEYFENRQDDFLLMDLPQGHGWPELCGFLGVDIPSEPFPHANKASVSRKIKNYFQRLRRGGN